VSGLQLNVYGFDSWLGHYQMVTTCMGDFGHYILNHEGHLGLPSLWGRKSSTSLSSCG